MTDPTTRRSKRWRFAAALALAASGPAPAADPGTKAAPSDPITIRTETYPRPPYSGATYYVYERSGTVICTKLEVCNKFDACDTRYVAGRYRDDEDVRTGEPYGRTDAVPIAREKQGRHQCLVRFHLR